MPSVGPIWLFYIVADGLSIPVGHGTESFKEMMLPVALIYGKYFDELSAAGHGKGGINADGRVFAVVCHR